MLGLMSPLKPQTLRDVAAVIMAGVATVLLVRAGWHPAVLSDYATAWFLEERALMETALRSGFGVAALVTAVLLVIRRG